MFDDALALLAALRPYAPLAAILFGPRVLALVRAYRSSAPADPLSPALLALLAVQVAYAAYALLVPPYDVFASHGLGTLTPSRTLAERVLLAAGYTRLPEPGAGDPLADLLARLGTTAGRQTYLRWGHAVVMSCGWCRAPSDWAIAALPGILGPYALQAALVGAMGWQWLAGRAAGRRAARYRLLAGAGIAATCAAELAARWGVDLRIQNGEIFHLSSVIHAARLAALTMITALYVLLPVRTPPALAIQEELASALDSAAHTNRLAHGVRGAVVRDPALLATATRGEIAFARAEDAAFRTDDVQAALKSVGYARTGPGRTGARSWLDGVWNKVSSLSGQSTKPVQPQGQRQASPPAPQAQATQAD